MRPVICVHGVSERSDAGGFSLALRRACERVARRHRLGYLTWREVVWSDLSDLPGGAVSSLADVALDVVRYDRDPILKRALHARIRASLSRHPDAIVVAHSLGSVAVVDLLCTESVEVGGLITLGSPLALSGALVDYATRRDHVAHTLDWLDWLDVWSDADPVHTGSLAGLEVIDGGRGLEAAGYLCESRRVELGSHPLHAHVGYWRQPMIAGWVVEMATEAA